MARANSPCKFGRGSLLHTVFFSWREQTRHVKLSEPQIFKKIWGVKKRTTSRQSFAIKNSFFSSGKGRPLCTPKNVDPIAPPSFNDFKTNRIWLCGATFVDSLILPFLTVYILGVGLTYFSHGIFLLAGTKSPCKLGRVGARCFTWCFSLGENKLAV